MEASFILALFAHGYKVKTTTLFHLLKGKRTSSVLVYGFFYGALRFIGSQPTLTFSSYQKILTELAQHQLLRLDLSTNEGQITQQGQQHLQERTFSLNNYPCIDYYRYGKNHSEIWRLLQFSVQVVSLLSYGNTRYIPLDSSPLHQRYLKNWLKAFPKNKLIALVKENWIDFLGQLSTAESNYLAAQFSGYRIIGQIPQQLHHEELSAFENILWQLNTEHHLYQVILTEESEQPVTQLIRPLMTKNQNQSLQTTLHLIQAGHSLEEVAILRNIKQSTVNDHLLELALNGSISSFDFIQDRRLLNSFYQKPTDLLTWRYQQWKARWPDLSYLDFRLTQIGLVQQGRAQL